MTIEERVRRMLAEAVAAEPAPSGAPFDRAVRRRRRRSLRAAVVAVALLLAATVVVTGVHALTTKPGAVPTVPPAVPTGWKTFQNVGFYNLKFRYPIDWGQYCLSPGHDCGAKSINASIQATSQALLDRYSQVAEQIVRTFQPARPTAASNGDPHRPSSCPDQWRPGFSAEHKVSLDGP